MLLELAMILFLVGIAVLLWTLDDVVATGVTVVVAAFLITVSAFTILPVMRKQCPYKSPTTWTVVSAYRFLSSMVVHVSQHWNKFDSPSPLEPSHSLGAESSTRTWREHDVQNWTEKSLSLGLRAGLPSYAQQAEPNTMCGRILQGFRVTQQAELFWKDINETMVLLRALCWVRRAYQDSNIDGWIAQCLQEIHPIVPNDIPDVEPELCRTVANYFVTASLATRDNLHQPHLAMHDAHDSNSTLAKILAEHDYYTTSPSSGDSSHERSLALVHVGTVSRLEKQHIKIHSAPLAVAHDLALLPQLLASDFRTVARQLHSTGSPNFSSASARAAFELISALVYVHPAQWDIPITQWFSTDFRDILTNPTVYVEVQRRYPGIRLQVFL